MKCCKFKVAFALKYAYFYVHLIQAVLELCFSFVQCDAEMFSFGEMVTI